MVVAADTCRPRGNRPLEEGEEGFEMHRPRADRQGEEGDEMHRPHADRQGEEGDDQTLKKLI